MPQDCLRILVQLVAHVLHQPHVLHRIGVLQYLFLHNGLHRVFRGGTAAAAPGKFNLCDIIPDIRETEAPAMLCQLRLHIFCQNLLYYLFLFFHSIPFCFFLISLKTGKNPGGI